ncbi:MAG: hypothetical protein A2X11_02430 [Bacteroidetes bacterium GWE2_42_24]|nr:MAG: hypothetical protein A2X11_02430 [Bacteroidetes bacterium GWE2_42_24]OFY25396.1 MAG: hypothetical protein A2X09_02885 [Bacteroidetes bacterium GWF2_43_11]PKP23705.1 MAG: hypothetical protein CVU06_06885 [Bacteroidetes bacterium HGW-Bacteroidetes-22]
MQEIDQLVTDIERKINGLISQLHIKEAENKKLVSELSQMSQTIENLLARIGKLEEENKILKIAHTLTTGTDTTDTKKQINQLVREIDHCISLLNG